MIADHFTALAHQQHRLAFVALAHAEASMSIEQWRQVVEAYEITCPGLMADYAVWKATR